MRFPAGTLLGPYEIRSPIGAGGMGEVYRARDTRLGRDVAIKVTLADAASDASRLQRFEQEARVAGGLSHPHVCAVYDVGSHDGAPFVVMELLEGESLRERLARGPLPLRTALDLGAQAAEGLIAAHARGIVHRDLKPANLFITVHNQLKILDFGLAKLTPAASPGEGGGMGLSVAATESGAILGTVAYMAPEQVLGESVDARADVFALGAVLFEMLTGQHPFGGETQIDRLHAILHEEPAALGDLLPDAPAPLGRLLRRCLARDPERRVQTAKDVRNELDELRHEVSSAGVAEGGRPKRSEALVERRLVLTAPMLRELQESWPRLVGRPMTWLDNQVESKTLVVLVWGGTGADASAFENVLRVLPYRAVAPTLVGFERHETYRPALGIDDHSRLLRFFLREVVRQCQPSRTMLVGFSASADHLLRLNHDEAAGGVGVPVDALLVLGSNVSIETCFVTEVYSGIDATDPAGMLAALRALGAGIDSLSTWLVVQSYISRTFLKLGTDLAPLKRFAAELRAPFEQPGEPVADWYRAACRRVPHVRLVYSDQEAGPLEALLARHLESNVLGDEFDERSFVVEPVHHLELIETSLLLRHIESLLEDVK